MNKQKLYKIVGGIFILLFILFGFISRQQQDRDNTISPLALNRVPGISFNIQLDINKASYPDVSTLPVYTLLPSNISQGIADNIANNLGFPPTTKNEFNDINTGKVNVWFDDNGRSLRIIPGLGVIDYKTSTGESDVNSGINIPDSEAINLSSNFITNMNILSNNFTLGEPGVDYIVLEHEGKIVASRSNAQFIEIRYPLTINNFLIMNDTPGVGVINILLNNEGEIVSAYINTVPPIESEGEFTLKTYEEFAESINQAELQMLDNGTIAIYQISEDLITNITIERVDIVYYEEQKSTRKTLQPIFELNGTARLSNGQQVSALLYLQAINTVEKQ